jgi:hypothetical protein
VQEVQPLSWAQGPARGLRGARLATVRRPRYAAGDGEAAGDAGWRPRGARCRAVAGYNAVRPIPPLLLEQSILIMQGVRPYRQQIKVAPVRVPDGELRLLSMPALLLMGEREWVVDDPAAALERLRRLVPRASCLGARRGC